MLGMNKEFSPRFLEDIVIREFIHEALSQYGRDVRLKIFQMKMNNISLEIEIVFFLKIII